MMLTRKLTMQNRKGGACRTFRSGAGEVNRIVDSRLRSLLRYWLSLRGDRLVPDRRDFDPTQVASTLGYFWICCKEPESGRFRFRLAGEHIRDLVGRPLAGAYVEEVFPAIADELNEDLKSILQGPALHHMHGPLYRGDNRWIDVERLALPVSVDGVVSTVLGATLFSWSDGGKPIAAQLAGSVLPTIIPVSELRPSDLPPPPSAQA